MLHVGCPRDQTPGGGGRRNCGSTNTTRSSGSATRIRRPPDNPGAGAPPPEAWLRRSPALESSATVQASFQLSRMMTGASSTSSHSASMPMPVDASMKANAALRLPR